MRAEGESRPCKYRERERSASLPGRLNSREREPPYALNKRPVGFHSQRMEDKNLFTLSEMGILILPSSGLLGCMNWLETDVPGLSVPSSRVISRNVVFIITSCSVITQRTEELSSNVADLNAQVTLRVKILHSDILWKLFPAIRRTEICNYAYKRRLPFESIPFACARCRRHRR